VTCTNSSLAEVGGEAALYEEPEDIMAMSQWMETFENASVDMNKLVADSMTQAGKFTWKSCAKKTIEVYKQCLDL
jgi:hypothetical protein